MIPRINITTDKIRDNEGAPEDIACKESVFVACASGASGSTTDELGVSATASSVSRSAFRLRRFFATGNMLAVNLQMNGSRFRRTCIRGDVTIVDDRMRVEQPRRISRLRRAEMIG
jgi:hypothetical protein